MKWFLELGNRYAAHSNWTDFALTKFCLCAMGILIGTFVPQEYAVPVRILAGVIFAAAYLPLMVRMVRVIRKKDP